MKSTWVTVALFEERQAGKTLEDFLRNERIEARTFNDKLIQVVLFLCPPRAVFRVQVRDKFFKMAVELLNKKQPPVLAQAVQCPDCGSLLISYPQMTRKFFLPTILLHLGIIFRFIKHKAYCETCHCLWRLDKPAPQPVAHTA